jgi:D-glycero-D-manno-heptose 1,7-bisphosphate phosphatase
MHPACFFDRDGVVNELITRDDGRKTSPWNLSELKYIPKIQEAVMKVKLLGFSTFIVTNQPGVVDGDMSLQELAEININMQKYLGVVDIKTALYRESENYKPNGGMIASLIKQYNIDRNKSYMIGDRWKDIVAGYREGLTTIFIGNKYESPEEYYKIAPDYIARDAYAASAIIVDEAGDWKPYGAVYAY